MEGLFSHIIFICRDFRLPVLVTELNETSVMFVQIVSEKHILQAKQINTLTNLVLDCYSKENNYNKGLVEAYDLSSLLSTFKVILGFVKQKRVSLFTIWIF